VIGMDYTVTTATGGRRKCAKLSFDSVDDAWAAAKRDRGTLNRFLEYGKSFTHLDHGTMDEVEGLVKDGWSDQLGATLSIAEHAVSLVEAETSEWRPAPRLDVSGQDVDVALFLDGEPECMIDYPLTETVSAGRVITVCASVCRSAAVDTDSIIRQGQGIVALAVALERCGYGLELYADWSNTAHEPGKTPTICVRTLVKAATDELDVERVMFAIAHPAFHRVVTFTAANDIPDEDVKKRHGIQRNAGGYYGTPEAPLRDLPEGTIYLPHLYSGSDVPDADVKLMDYLRTLGIVTD
jgi:hypothetical protein